MRLHSPLFGFRLQHHRASVAIKIYYIVISCKACSQHCMHAVFVCFVCCCIQLQRFRVVPDGAPASRGVGYAVVSGNDCSDADEKKDGNP